MKKIKAIMIKPNETPQTTELKVSIDEFNKAVSVDTDYDCLARCKKLEKGVYILYADESTTFMFAPNRRYDDSIICGIFYIIGAKDNLPVSLTDSQIVKYTNMFAIPEEISEQEALFHCLNDVCKEIDDIYL